MMIGHRKRILVVGLLLILALGLGGCGAGSREVEAEAPQIQMLAPADGSIVLLGSTVTIRAIVEDDSGIVSSELRVDGQENGNGQVAQNDIPPGSAVTELTQYLLWTPERIGIYKVQVRAENRKDIYAVSTPVTLIVQDRSPEQTAVAGQLATRTPDPNASPTPTLVPSPTVTSTPLPTSTSTPLPSATFTPLPTFTLIATFTPLPSPTMSPFPTITSAAVTRPAVCNDNSEFVSHVTIHDNSIMPAGAAFNKVWQLRNTGTCVWDKSYDVVFVSGQLLSQQASHPLPSVVYPGDTVNIGVPMVAPQNPGTYYSQWQLQNPAGSNFGSLIGVLIIVN